MSVIVFVVGNAVQSLNAQAVAERLSDAQVWYLDLWTCRRSLAVPTSRGHVPPTSGRALVQVRRSIRALPPHSMIVLPQDVGVLQRTIARAAHDAGHVLVLMPDGVVAATAIDNGSRARRVVRAAADGLLRGLGLTAGRPGAMASSKPDLILSWGPGWDTAFGQPGAGRIVHVGCPRMDDFVHIGPPPGEGHVLVCSQPMHLPSWSRDYADPWYDLLERLATRHDPHVRVRLHPAEREGHRVPAAVRVYAEDRPLVADLAWCDVLASPFSTTAIDALAAGRTPVLLSPDRTLARRVAAYPIFGDERIPIVGWNDTMIETSRAAAQGVALAALRSSYLVSAGSSAQAAALALKAAGRA